MFNPKKSISISSIQNSRFLLYGDRLMVKLECRWIKTEVLEEKLSCELLGQIQVPIEKYGTNKDKFQELNSFDPEIKIY